MNRTSKESKANGRSYEQQFDQLLAVLRRHGVLMDEVARPEERLTVHLPYPRLFDQLIREHSFVAFEISEVEVFSNLKGEEDNLERLLRDKALTEALVGAGFLPFGQPAGGSYDRICFDIRGAKRPIDAPLVLMEHEAVLTHFRVPTPVVVARGILDLAK